MRKIIFIAVLFVSHFGFSQGGPKMNVAKFVGELTTTERNSLDVPTGERWLIWNATTEQFEHAGSDDVWYEMGWDNLIDDHIVPDTPGAYDIGGQSDPFRSLVIEDVFINDAADSKWRFTLNSDDLVFYDYDGNWQERYRMNDSGTPTGPNDLINLGSLPDIPAVDASGFSGNLTTSDNTLQKIADALDGLGAASGVNTFENKITIKDDGVSGEDMYLDFKNYSGTLRANIWYSDGGLDRGLNIINATSNTVLTIPDAGDPRVNDIFRAEGFKLLDGGSGSELLKSNGFTADLIDDDTFATATSQNIPSSESVKAYVDAEISGSGAVPSDTGASDGDVLTTDGAGTYTWETPSGGGSSLPVDDTTALVQDPSDNTKQVRIDAENVGTGDTAVLSVSDDNQFQDNLKVKGESVSNNSFFGLYKNDGSTIIGGFSGFGGTNTVEFGNSISSESFSIDGSGNYKLSGFSGGGNQGLGVDNTGQLFTADYVEGTISGRTGTDVTNVMLQTQAQFDSDGATSTGEVVFISDASPAEVVTSATIAMEGWKMYNDSSTDAATITLSDCDPGETLTVYINRASAPTLAGTGLTFNQLPNTTAFAAATDMMIIFEVSYDSTTIDYYYVER